MKLVRIINNKYSINIYYGMKETYVNPIVTVRDTHVKNYILWNSGIADTKGRNTFQVESEEPVETSEIWDTNKNINNW